MTRAPVLLLLIATHLLFFGRAVEASDRRAMQLTYEPWTKVCLGNSNCFVAVGARGACVPSGGGVAIGVPDDKSASLTVNFGTKRTLDGAMSVQIDHDAPIPIPNPVCDRFGCRAKFEIDGEFIERLKRSQTITIEVTGAAHQKISLSFSLADFAKAYDGPGTEPKVFEESQEKLKELLRQRAETNQPPPQCED